MRPSNPGLEKKATIQSPTGAKEPPEGNAKGGKAQGKSNEISNKAGNKGWQPKGGASNDGWDARNQTRNGSTEWQGYEDPHHGYWGAPPAQQWGGYYPAAPMPWNPYAYPAASGPWHSAMHVPAPYVPAQYTNLPWDGIGAAAMHANPGFAMQGGHQNAQGHWNSVNQVQPPSAPPTQGKAGQMQGTVVNPVSVPAQHSLSNNHSVPQAMPKGGEWGKGKAGNPKGGRGPPITCGYCKDLGLQSNHNWQTCAKRKAADAARLSSH